MDHIQAAQEAVCRKSGPGFENVAACAAVAARTFTVNELEEHYRARLDSHAMTLRVALALLREDHRHSQAAAEDRLQDLLEELEK